MHMPFSRICCAPGFCYSLVQKKNVSINGIVHILVSIHSATDYKIIRKVIFNIFIALLLKYTIQTNVPNGNSSA